MHSGYCLFVTHTRVLNKNTNRRDHTIFGFTTTKVESSNLAYCEVYSIQHYVIKFVSDFRQVDGFLRVLLFPPPIKLTATI